MIVETYRNKNVLVKDRLKNMQVSYYSQILFFTFIEMLGCYKRTDMDFAIILKKKLELGYLPLGLKNIFF